jgi:MSHA biogenesis protein MshJ
MRSWESLAARIDALTLRERGFVMAGVLAVTYFLWVGLIAQPMEQKQRELNGNQERITAEIAALSAQAQAMMQQSKDDPNEIHRAELESLKTELAKLNKDLAGTTDHLVPPGQMAKVLEAVLQGTNGLELQQVTSLGSSPLVPESKKEAAKRADADADNQDTEAPVRKVYKHGIKLVLQGSFFSVLDFMRKLEQLDWKFFWDGVEFRVVDYPDATVEITVFTISLEPTWIGA